MILLRRVVKSRPYVRLRAEPILMAGGRAVDHSTEILIGIYVAKARNAIAIADSEGVGEVRYVGEVDASEESMRRLFKRLAANHERLHFCYEAGPTGYGLYRLITTLGYACMVVAPSVDRVKPNRRDAMTLAKLLRVGTSDICQHCFALYAESLGRRAVDRVSPTRRSNSSFMAVATSTRCKKHHFDAADRNNVPAYIDDVSKRAGLWRQGSISIPATLPSCNPFSARWATMNRDGMLAQPMRSGARSRRRLLLTPRISTSPRPRVSGHSKDAIRDLAAGAR
jgi:hypothetical protein